MEEEIQKGEVILYQPNETVKLEVRLENDTVWLTQQQIADLFGTKRPAITKHLKNIYSSGELTEQSTCSILEHMGNDGKQRYEKRYYNLDAILSIGYRVNSINATLFRRWANGILKEYLLRGYSINSQLLQMEQRIGLQLITQHHEIQKLKETQQEQQEQIDLYIKTNTLPQERLFQNGCVFDAWSYVSKLIREAKQEIILIDNYVDETVLVIMAKRAANVKATIHTRYYEKVKTDIDKFNKQYPDKAVTYVQLPQHNHDRFLIIDEDVYHLGASLKDLGNTWGAMIKMNEIKKAEIMHSLYSSIQ